MNFLFIITIILFYFFYLESLVFMSRLNLSLRCIVVCRKQLFLRTFALIVYAYPYCASNSCRNAMLRHARARAQRKKSIHMMG